jgi:hypothetical protein
MSDCFLSLPEDDRRRFFLYVIGRHQLDYYRRLRDAGRKIASLHRGFRIYHAKANEGLVFDLYDTSLEDWMAEQ